MTRQTIVTILCIAAASAIGPRTAEAQVKPAVIVLLFENAAGGGGLSGDARARATDALAVKLVESGAFRVLDRQFAQSREQAAAAGVDYFLTGTVTRTGNVTVEAVDVRTHERVWRTVAYLPNPDARRRVPRAPFFLGGRGGISGLLMMAARTRLERVHATLEFDRAIASLGRALINEAPRLAHPVEREISLDQ